MSITTISPKVLAERSQAKPVTFIDVRTPGEYAELHALGTNLIPLDRLDPKAVQAMYPDDDIYVICRAGNRSRMACEKLIAAGVNRVISVDGGTDAWTEAGLPVVRGRKTMSLERQVRITAGSIVLTGVLLGSLFEQYLLGIAGFIGAGLIFSGLTDTCGMGMVLAKMPWNQRGSKPICGTK
jgi:rhodanese-related sulfurtransferase